MNQPVLDLSSLIKALTSLKEAACEYEKQPDNTFIRDATIQRFEYSYELTYKMLKRYLEMTEPNAEEIDQMSFANLVRTGAEKGLLKNSWDIWSAYRHARNLTSHTYDEKKAIEVCQIVPDFLNDAEYLMMQLKMRIQKG
jgi:nucleotidyltransferase substrate binding protein (TIGR01987 family)